MEENDDPLAPATGCMNGILFVLTFLLSMITLILLLGE